MDIPLLDRISNGLAATAEIALIVGGLTVVFALLVSQRAVAEYFRVRRSERYEFHATPVCRDCGARFLKPETRCGQCVGRRLTA